MRSQAADINWAVHEFADADLGDVRRTKRLVELAHVLAQHPPAALPEACGDGALLKAAYRFFAHDDIAPQDCLSSHIESTYSRLDTGPLGLAGQETTAGDWTGHPATPGVGPLGSPACQGLHVHSTLACPPERVPLGLLAQHVWARDPDDVGKRKRRKQGPSGQKASQQWLTSLEAVCSARAWCAPTRFVSMGDREADVFDLLAAERPAGGELLVRAAWDRCVEEVPERYVWATVEAQPVGEPLLLQVPRRGTQPGRDAPLALRLCPVTLCPPRYRKAEGLPSVARWAVQVRELDPPRDVKPIEWLLWTTVEVRTAADAIERVTWDACRWGIEVWHRMVKSGCRIAERQWATGARLPRCLTLSRVMAWRVLYAIMLARAVPEMPCNVLLEIEEWQALYCAIPQCPTPPEAPPALAQAVRWIAQLGGVVGRRRRDQPGAETLWRGWQHLADLTSMYRIRRSAPP